MVARTVVHRFHAAEILVCQTRVVRRSAAYRAVVARVGGVDRRAVDHVEPRAVGQRVEPVGLRIIGQQGVDAPGFERLHLGGGRLLVGCGVVALGPQRKLLVETVEAAVAVFALSEADVEGDILPQHAVALGVERHLVERLLLVVPLIGVGVVDEPLDVHRVARAALHHDLARTVVEQLALRIVDVVAGGDRLFAVVGVLDHDVEFQHAVFARRVGNERHRIVVDVEPVLEDEVAVGVGQPRRRRVGLQLRSLRGAQVEHHGVASGADVGRDEEFARRAVVLDVGYAGVVDQKRVGRADVLQMEVDVAVGQQQRYFDDLSHRGGVGLLHDDLRGERFVMGDVAPTQQRSVVARVEGDEFRTEYLGGLRSRARKGEKSRPECNESFHLDILKLPAAMSQAGGSGANPIVPQCPPPLHAGGRGQRYD